MAVSRRTTAALRESKARLDNLYSLSPVGIFLCTPEGKYLSANQALADILGYGTAEALMMPPGPPRQVREARVCLLPLSP